MAHAEESRAMKMTAALTTYNLACQAQNVSRPTWRWYQQKLRAFISYAEETGVTEIEQVTSTLVNAFTAHVQANKNVYGQPISSHTVHGYTQVIKGFMSWAASEELIDEKQVRRIKMPKVEQKIIQVFSSEQINRLYAACDDAKERWVAARDRAIVAVLLDTGIRANELCDLTRDRCFLDDSAPYLLINGKGRKQRIVGLGKQSAYRLNLYITRYRPKCTHEYAVVSFKERQLTPKGLDDLLYRLRDRAGISGVRCSAYTCRHSYAFNFIKAGGDVLRLSRLLGHTSVQVTENYLRCFGSQDARGGLSVFDALRR
jgi:site-specific recombinase XerD